MAFGYGTRAGYGVAGGGPVRADLTSLPPVPDAPIPQGQQTAAEADYTKRLLAQTGQPLPVNISDEQRQWLLAQQGALAGKFADQAQQGYNAYGQQGQQALDYYRGQMMGQNSVSAEQLRQGLGQMYGQQMSAAAGASPRNGAMAARLAMTNMGRAGMGMAGQQAIAGLQERNAAAAQYGGMLGTLRGQDLSAATGSRQSAMAGYGAGATGPPQPSWIQQYGPPIAAGLAYLASDRALKTDVAPGDAAANAAIGALAPGPAAPPAGLPWLQRIANGFSAGLRAMPQPAVYGYPYPYPSDRALKVGVQSGDGKANAAIDKLQPYSYSYKDQSLGAGPQVGVMAQDLEKAGLGQAVVRTPIGLAVDPGKLTGANTAMIAALGKRVATLEGDQPSPPLPSLPRSAAQESYLNSPEGRKQVLMSAAGSYDPRAVAAQQALDRRRSLLQELTLRSAGAYPGPARPFDPAATAAQGSLDLRRGVGQPPPLPSWAYGGGAQ